MVKWEYCCQDVQSGKAAEIEASLLRLGDHGWEAICGIPTGPYILLKRPKAEQGIVEGAALSA